LFERAITELSSLIASVTLLPPCQLGSPIVSICEILTSKSLASSSSWEWQSPCHRSGRSVSLRSSNS